MVIFIIILILILLLFIIGSISEDKDVSAVTSKRIVNYSSDSFYKGVGFGDLTFFKEALIEKNGAYCEMCGQTDVPLQVDHIIPISKGGLNEISNMQLLCYECHMKKHNYYFDELGFSNRKVPKKYELLNWAYKTNSKIEIKYKKYDGTVTKRIVRPITSIYYKKYGVKGAYYITAFCYLRN